MRETVGTLSKDDNEGYENVVYKYYGLYCSDFSIIPRRSESKLRVIILRTNLVWIFREKFENSSSVARVLNMTSYSIIPRRCQDENGKEIYQNVNRTYRACRAIVFAT